MPWIERVRTEQPLDAGVGLDWSSPFARGLIFLSVGRNARNTVQPSQAANTSPIGGVGSAGACQVYSGTKTAWNLPPNPSDWCNTISVGAVFAPASLSADMSIIGYGYSNGGINTPVEFGTYSTAGALKLGRANADGYKVWASPSGAISVGKTSVSLITQSAAATSCIDIAPKMYVGGVKLGASTAVYSGTGTGLASSASATFNTGGRDDAAALLYGQVALSAVWNRELTDAEAKEWTTNPWQLFEKERIWVPVAAGGPVTHATTGALTGQLGSIAGTAAHVAVHGASGTPTGQLGSVVGSAARLRAFASTGALTGQGSAIVGSATRAGGTTTHDATGTPTGQGSAVVGTAAHVAIHGTSGTLVGTSALLAGTAVHSIPHGTSGDLTGPGSVVVGSALNGLASVTKSGVNRLWLIDYYTKEFAAKEKLRNPEPAKTKAVSKKRAAVVAAKVEASVAKAEKDLVTLTKSMKDVQDAQVFIYNAIQQAKQAPQAESVDFMAVAKRYEKKMQQEEHELLLLAMVL